MPDPVPKTVNLKRVPDLVPQKPGTSIAEHLRGNLRALGTDQQMRRQRGLRQLARFAHLRLVPSFILRTLNDVVHNRRAALSGIQRSLLTAWDRAGLKRDHAARLLERFYSLGEEAIALVDTSYFDTPSTRIDEKLVADVRSSDLKKYFQGKHLSPFRIEAAVEDARQVHALKPAERQLIAEPLLQVAGARNAKMVNWRERLAAEPPPPEIVTFYRLRAGLHEYRIVESDDNIGGKADPRFVVNSFRVTNAWTTPDAPYSLYKTTFNSLMDDRDKCGWMAYVAWCEELRAARDRVKGIDPIHEMMSEAYEKGCDLTVFDPEGHWVVGTKPLITVNAFEDDALFTDETRKYMEFGLQFAATISQFDPTKILTLVVSIGDIAWDILVFFDDLNEDDRFYPQMWALDESKLNVGQATVFVPEFDMREVDGVNHWGLRIRVEAFDPLTTQPW